MKLHPGSAILTLLLLVLPMASPAFEMPREHLLSGLSLQGYTGILNTPSAHVTEEGFIQGLYSNQKETMWRDSTPYQDNYLFSVGAFSIAEVGGRLTNAPGVPIRDLSANVKLTSEPFFREHPYAPVFAVGYQDVGGGAKLLQNRYAVVSEDVWRLRLSTGYGFGPRRMKGVFGGGEFKAHDWVYLLAENDTRETNLGVRIATPPFWKIPISFTATAKTSLSHRPGNVDMGVGFSFPLDFSMRTATRGWGEPAMDETGTGLAPSPEPLSEGIGGAADAHRPKEAAAGPPSGGLTASPPAPATPGGDRNARLAALRDRLVKAGFMNVRVGNRENRTLVVEYENVVFNHNELDALGVVSGMAAEAFRDDFRFIRVIIVKKGIRVLQVSMPLPELATYVREGRNLSELAELVVVSTRIDDEADVSFTEGGSANSSALTAALVLWPGLTTFVGTEQGAFDYFLSLKPELFVNLWKGGVVNARWDIPLSWSDNLNDGKPFRDRRTPTRLERLMLFQGIKPLPDVMVNLGAGMVSPDVYGTLNELVWTPGTGEHAVRLVQSWGRDDQGGGTTETYLASYRYYFSPLDLFLTGTGGKFLSQDRGFAVEMKRMFGDTGFAVYYKNSTATDNRHWQAAGVTFSFPLTPARDMKHYYGMQLRGTDEWRYSQETVIVSKNQIPSFPLAAAPLPTASLYDQYQNRDRLNESYILSHLFRLREAWSTYHGEL
ncbi:MAG TPA: YjbH domain-containing protein [Desulfuromonadaceae bacterium]